MANLVMKVHRGFGGAPPLLPYDTARTVKEAREPHNRPSFRCSPVAFTHLLLSGPSGLASFLHRAIGVDQQLT